MDDVFVLPVHKAIDWVRNPTKLKDIKVCHTFICLPIIEVVPLK